VWDFVLSEGRTASLWEETREAYFGRFKPLVKRRKILKTNSRLHRGYEFESNRKFTIIDHIHPKSTKWQSYNFRFITESTVEYSLKLSIVVQLGNIQISCLPRWGSWVRISSPAPDFQLPKAALRRDIEANSIFSRECFLHPGKRLEGSVTCRLHEYVDWPNRVCSCKSIFDAFVTPVTLFLHDLWVHHGWARFCDAGDARDDAFEAFLLEEQMRRWPSG
jgi:hypothetical protein